MTVKSTIHEATRAGLLRCELFGKWEWKPHNRIGVPVLFSDHPGSRAILKSHQEICAPWIIQHAWSGSVNIESLNTNSLVSLCQQKENIEYVFDDQPLLASHEFLITVDDAKGANGRPGQVWLVGVKFSSYRPVSKSSLLINENYRLIRADTGNFIVDSRDTIIPRFILRDGCWEPRVVEYFRKYAHSGTCAIDIGANFGHHSVVLSQCVGNDGVVLSIEAQPAMHRLLTANAAINRCDNIVPLNMIADECDRELRIPTLSKEANFGAFSLPQVGSKVGVSIKAMTADSIYRTFGGDRPVSFVKIDVQSYEAFVMRGLKAIISKFKPAVLVEINPEGIQRRGGDFKEIYDLLLSNNYKIENLGDFPVDARSAPIDLANSPSEWEILALPKQ